MPTSTRTLLLSTLLAAVPLGTGCDAMLDAAHGQQAPQAAAAEDGELSRERAPWCHQGTIHLSPTITWDAAELAAMSSLYGTDVWPVDDESIAHGTADAFCADEYSLGGLIAAGETVFSTSPSSGSYGESGSDLGPLSLPDGYSLSDGLEFQCEMCGYYPLLELTGTEEPFEPTSPREGMTWLRKDIDPVTGVVTVGCDNGVQCDPINGDTPCDTALPLLCTLDLGLPQPVSVVSPNIYYTWAGSVVATTPPLAPELDGLNTLAAADDACATEFGAGWRTAEFHDGWGWNFIAYGNVGEEPRFWVNIDDQPGGTCWSQ